MNALLNDRPTQPRRRWRFYIHKIQKTYAVWLGILLFVYSLIASVLAFFAPYILPAIKLISPIPLEERAVAATQFLVLAQTVWPAIIVLILGSALLSLSLTHRLAGPLYRLEQSVKEWAQGNLSLRIRFRKRDELHELGGVFNEALAHFERTIIEIRDRQAGSCEALRQVLSDMRAQSSVNREMLERLESALKEGERVDEVFKTFRLSDSA